ncbi:MAG: hypothetical protein JW984_15050 [Deltaproteobacteria bacterium]|uniref:Uncharacterized protein n=1 Tax=Candidatus Zymogenus saltonus TaxID=2844893 RepID=A0A9D8KIL8_9DELT|nr:hypothetical protein [Candidatus Zymogenus saltonus]
MANLIESKTGFSAHWIKTGEGPMMVEKIEETLSDEEREIVERLRIANERQKRIVKDVLDLPVEEEKEPGVYERREDRIDAVMDKSTYTIDPSMIIPDRYLTDEYVQMFDGYKPLNDLTDDEKRQIVAILEKAREIAEGKSREKK